MQIVPGCICIKCYIGCEGLIADDDVIGALSVTCSSGIISHNSWLYF